MAKSFGEQLDEVQEAITAVLTSQSYKMNGRELTRADLSALEMREDRLISQVEKYGADYIVGVSKQTMKMEAHVRFH